ncbi:DUF2867 domain-containing protein [Lysobacter sp.]|uniref:DUF2867 domain-containing protein n=1 Tax=Lysobacter sp. TaxID=72226 RepID=UPI002D28801E|nr:DUF2867 domain-containing protein [Lysobacter sp.]HZX78232.1 DUF2867 domain-containing protein [Lysobacter sp.]
MHTDKRQSTMPSVPPEGSLVAQLIPGSDFHDAWSTVAKNPALSALEQFLNAAAATPAWVNACMAVRNCAVSLLGLKDLGPLGGFNQATPVHGYLPGDRVGIFTLVENTFDEVLLKDQDKHLTVIVSVHLQRVVPSQVVVTVTTVVTVHNLLGHLYMAVIKPMHRLIAPAVLSALHTR